MAEKWIHSDDVTIKLSTGGKPFKLEFFDPEAAKKASDGEKNLTNKDRMAPSVSPTDPEFWTNPYWKNTLVNTVYESPASDLSKDEAKKVIKNFLMNAEGVLPPMLENMAKEEEEEKGVPEEIEEEAEKLLLSNGLILEIDDAIHDSLAGEHQNALTNFLCCLSTLSGEPLNLRWSGRASTGKTAITTAVLRVIPDSWKLVYVGMTRKSFYYDPNAEAGEDGKVVDLNGKVLVILEEDNAREFLEEARPVLSHDMQKHQYRFTDTSNGAETRYITLKGWPAYVGLSVDPESSIELGTRELQSSPEMSKTKYGRVIDWKAQRSFAPWMKPDKTQQAVIKRALEKLENYDVWLPFVRVLRENFSADQARSQRDWDKLIAAVESVALLHQYQRRKIEVDGEDYLMAEPVDAIIALEIIESALQEAMTGATEDQKRFVEYLSKKSQEGSKSRWTYKELQDLFAERFGERIGRSTIQRRYVDPLVEIGVLEKYEESKAHEISIVSPLTSSNLSNLREMIEELSDLEMDEEYLRDKLCAAGGAQGGKGDDNPKIIPSPPPAQGRSYKDVRKELRYRFSQKKKEEPFPWQSESSEGSETEKKEREEKEENGEDGGEEEKTPTVNIGGKTFTAREKSEVKRQLTDQMAYSPKMMAEEIDLTLEKARAILEELYEERCVEKRPGPEKEKTFYYIVEEAEN